MKCPKCGYNSFEFLNACKKCGTELSSFKKSHRINSVLRPAAAVSAEIPQQSPPVAAVARRLSKWKTFTRALISVSLKHPRMR